MQKRAVWLGAALRLVLPVTGGHIPLLGADLQVSEDAVVFGAVTLLQRDSQRLIRLTPSRLTPHPPVSADRLIAKGKRLVSEGAVLGSGAARVVIEVAILSWQSFACVLAREATMNLSHANV